MTQQRAVTTIGHLTVLVIALTAHLS